MTHGPRIGFIFEPPAVSVAVPFLSKGMAASSALFLVPSRTPVFFFLNLRLNSFCFLDGKGCDIRWSYLISSPSRYRLVDPTFFFLRSNEELTSREVR